MHRAHYRFVRLDMAGCLLVAAFAAAKPANAVEIVDRVDWPNFLARQDLVWKRPPAAWESGAFLGNGLLGANVFATEDGAALKWHIGRSDVIDQGSRIPVGDLVLAPPGSSPAPT